MGCAGFLFVFSLYSLFLMDVSTAQMPGFVSVDCGGSNNFTDEIGLEWSPDNYMLTGDIVNIVVANETRKQYKTLRSFPADDNKYCYTFNVVSRTRYLIRATFLYGNFDNNNVYPKFDISFGPTRWATIVISDANTIELQELIFLATDPTISVCLSNATTGQPFISTLELRQFNGSIYFNQFESQFYLSVSARINFGAESDKPVRFPDDPFDRIWESDSVRKANYLVDVAPGTEKISTQMPIDVSRDEWPPQKVMQTAVVGRNGSLTYRLNLDGFPAPGWAFCYFAEIEDLGPSDARKFRFMLPGAPDLSKAVVNIQENAQGQYRLYEPGYYNISLPFVLSFRFGRTSDSTMGPLLNALEVNRYLKKSDGSADGPVLAAIALSYKSFKWANEGGDPCIPAPCKLSGKNLSGTIPVEFTKLGGLVELWLDNNSLSGPIPDFSGCPNLKIIHLEDNRLNGELPSSLADLSKLRELYIQNNLLAGTIPSGLLNKDLSLNYTGNAGLHKEKGGSHKNIIIGTSVAAAVMLIATITYFLLLKGKKKPPRKGESQHNLPPQKLASSLGDTNAEAAHYFTLAEIKDTTNNFERRIGSGGFGVVYYGRLPDGKEIAVKRLTNDSFQGKREFTNEVRPLTLGGGINWIKRLEIAEDAAKGIDYLHTGCVPAIIHRDLKTSNILLDKNMRAKVSDFGLSKLAVDGASHVSSIVRGTVGYLDPEYVFLLFLFLSLGVCSIISIGIATICLAKLHIESGDLQGIIDPALHEYDIQSMWKIAEKALMCVQPHGSMRPWMSEVIKEIQDALAIERGAEAVREGSSDEISRRSAHSSLNLGSLDIGSSDHRYLAIDESIARPTAR
ncbi:hypothetical protein SASPL_105665 [Salvia splendens]|uniref:Protein kinase domain-containing protein n=1 Tax=Salvia splendens TaxID=180675 RepID=A0A8X8YLH0_SALSN|nr:hypothetical protein SASPL_105665 [Salvia splendens]